MRVCARPVRRLLRAPGTALTFTAETLALLCANTQRPLSLRVSSCLFAVISDTPWVSSCPRGPRSRTAHGLEPFPNKHLPFLVCADRFGHVARLRASTVAHRGLYNIAQGCGFACVLLFASFCRFLERVVSPFLDSAFPHSASPFVSPPGFGRRSDPALRRQVPACRICA